MIKWSLSFCFMMLSLIFSSVALADTINFDTVPDAQGLDQFFFLAGDIDSVHFSTPDPYDPDHPELGGWLCLNRGNFTTLGVSSPSYSIFSGVEARGRIKVEFPDLVDQVGITGGDSGGLPDSFQIDAFDSAGNLLNSANTGLFSGGGAGGEYYVDQATLTLSTANIKYIYLYATTPPGSEGGVSFDDLDFHYQTVPIPSAVWMLGPGLAFLVGVRRRLSF